MKTLLPVLLAAAVAVSNAAPPEPRTRGFHLEYRATVKDIPARAKHVDLWIPLPQDDPYQQIHDRRIESAQSYQIAAAPDGNTMLHVGVDNPRESTLTLSIAFDATRKEHVQSRLSGGPRLARDEDSEELARYLRPDRLVPIDDQIRAWAREVVTQAHAHTDLEMARAIYNHVVATVKYDKTGKGWGRGDIYYACEERRGNCTDFHAIFIGYARALGIPARFAIGFPLPPGRGEGQIAGYHCWAEFYAKGIGWVPVDASEAAKNPDKREYFFGAHDENRLEFSKGRDLLLTPRQQGDPLNYFVYPYAEIDGKAFAGTELAVTYRDDPAAPDLDVQRAAMKKLSFLAGKWKGEARLIPQAGDPVERIQTEEAQYKLDGLILTIEGIGRNKSDGKVVLQAFGIISYDDERRTYRMRAFNDGRFLETEVKLTADGQGITWVFALGEIRSSAVMRIDEKGQWTELHEVAIGAQPPRKFMEVTVSPTK